MNFLTQAIAEGAGFCLLLIAPFLAYAAWRLGLGLGEDLANLTGRKSRRS